MPKHRPQIFKGKSAASEGVDGEEEGAVFLTFVCVYVYVCTNVCMRMTCVYPYFSRKTKTQNPPHM